MKVEILDDLSHCPPIRLADIAGWVMVNWEAIKKKGLLTSCGELIFAPPCGILQQSLPGMNICIWENRRGDLMMGTRYVDWENVPTFGDIKKAIEGE